METNITPGIIILLVGIWLLYWVGRRRFNRRGPGGMQHFSSYGRALGGDGEVDGNWVI